MLGAENFAQAKLSAKISKMKIIEANGLLIIKGTDNWMTFLNVVFGLILFLVGYFLTNWFQPPDSISMIIDLIGIAMMVLSPATIGSSLFHQFFSEAKISKNNFEVVYLNGSWKSSGDLSIEIDTSARFRRYVLSLRFGPTPVELPFLRKKDAVDAAYLVQKYYGENSRCDFDRARPYI